jgi:hypothetical protein
MPSLAQLESDTECLTAAIDALNEAVSPSGAAGEVGVLDHNSSLLASVIYPSIDRAMAVIMATQKSKAGTPQQHSTTQQQQQQQQQQRRRQLPMGTNPGRIILAGQIVSLTRHLCGCALATDASILLTTAQAGTLLGATGGDLNNSNHNHDNPRRRRHLLQVASQLAEEAAACLRPNSEKLATQAEALATRLKEAHRYVC